MFAVFHAVRGVPERRNVVRSYPGFSDAMKLIVGARLRLRAPGCRPGAAARDVDANPERIRSEARDENQSPIHLPTQSCSLVTRLHRSNRFSTFVNLILICDSDGQPVTMDVNPSNRVLSTGSARLRTALPRKVGFHRRGDSRKLLKGWSGRRDSNP